MHKTALVTGGTGGLGAAVTARLLDDGWHVVVPWVVESELERVLRRDGLELVQADLFDPEAVRAAVALAADDHNAPLQGVANLVGGFDAPGRIGEVPFQRRDDGVRCNAVRPSVIDTLANRKAMPNSDRDRWVKPAQIAAVIAHLLSADADATSGATVPVYGRA
jgi:NAD(P)-dependent dehydrogenase (short-subunit alcohol dehydrogenase family)